MDKPILFSGPMVRALLAGTKTQTRRVASKQPTQRPDGLWDHNQYEAGIVGADEAAVGAWMADFQRIQLGDRLYVREAWRCNGWATDVATIMYRASEGNGYTAMTEQYPVDGKAPMRVTGTWRPGIHMPRWASRLTLTVTDVRVERLQNCSEADAIAEGVSAAEHWPATMAYRDLWDSINGKGAWDANPWVAAYTFTVERGNIDKLAGGR